MLNFIINNLAVLLVLFSLITTGLFFWACRTKKDMRLNNATYTGRISGKKLNKSNTPKPMASYCGDPYDPHAKSGYSDGFLR